MAVVEKRCLSAVGLFDMVSDGMGCDGMGFLDWHECEYVSVSLSLLICLCKPNLRIMFMLILTPILTLVP
jgi:hypothetical protein